MAIKKRSISILKNIRQNKKKREVNRAIKREAKSSFKMAIKAIEKKETGTEKLRDAFKKIDKAVKKGVFHKNKANRLKSRLSRKYSAIV